MSKNKNKSKKEQQELDDITKGQEERATAGVSETDEKTTAEEAMEATESEEPSGPTAEEQLAKLADEHLRLRAEYDNFRKRTLKEKSDLIKHAAEKSVTAFLSVMDDFELALQNMRQADSVEGLIEGVEIIQSKFVATLKAQGVNAMEVIGTPFDPDKYDAVAMLPVEEQEKKGMVVDCVQTGYTLNDKVIRHPKVVVGQ